MIKTYFYGAMWILLVCLLGYSHYKAYKAGEYHIKEINHDAIQQAKNEKERIEKEHSERYEMARIGYSGAIRILNDRMRNLETLPRGKDVCMASSNSPEGTMPRSPEDTPRTITRLATFEGACDSAFYDAAMKQTLQCQALIDLLKK